MQYLLPFLCECAKIHRSYPQKIMVNSIRINVLFVGALKCITLGKSYPLNSQLIFDNEVDKIEEPFLWALVMLLTVLLNDSSVWTKVDTSRLLHYFLKKEFQNASTGNSFTKII